jgi:hypothetical protein
MNTPYNTGRVKIGIHYQPPARPWTPSRTEVMLQEALLAGRRPAAEIKRCPESIVKRALAAFWRWA